VSLDAAGTSAGSPDRAALTVRAAEPSEWSAIGELSVDGYVAGGLIPAGHPYSASLRDTAHRARRAIVLVAVDADGTLLGSVTFCRPPSPLAELARPGESEFRMLAVAPVHHGRGAGEALVRSCIDRARDVGDSAVVLSTLDVTAAARRLYLRLGFERTPERDWQPTPDIWLRAYRLELFGRCPSDA